MMKRLAVLFGVVLVIAIGHAQVPDQSPLAFEAASVRPSERPAPIGQVSPDRFFRPNTTVLLLLTYAYGVDPVQIEGGDSWMRDSRFHIDAKAAGRPTDEQMRAMVRQLLVERFKLKTHAETREFPRYALVKARNDGRLGDKIRPAVIDCRGISSTSDDLRTARASDRWACTRRILMQGSAPGTMRLITHGYALADFAQTIQTRAGRVIVDKTGLTGAYDVELETEGPQMPGQVPTTPEGLSLFTALQEQLGLKLESERGPVDVLVIDRVEKPTSD